jgi:hypothetical protein
VKIRVIRVLFFVSSCLRGYKLFMNIRLKIAEIYVPTFIKKAKLEELFDCTAAAFNCPVPPLKGLSFDKCLVKYAEFTREEAEKALQSGHDLHQIKQRLYQNAYRLGQNLRKSFHITTTQDVMTMGRILYRVIGMKGFSLVCQEENNLCSLNELPRGKIAVRPVLCNVL